MRTTLSFRLIGFYATVATLTVFLTLWVGSMIVKQQMVAAVRTILEAESREIELLLSDAQPPFTPESVSYAIQDHTEIDAIIFYFQVEDEACNLLFRSDNLAGDSLPEGEAGDRFHEGRLHFRLTGQETPGNMPVFVGEFQNDTLRVRIASGFDTQLSILRQFRILMFAAIPAVFFLSLAVGYLLSQVMLKPLRAIQETAQRITGANLRERIVVPPSPDELSRLAGLLNDTFDRLEKAFDQVRRFAGDCSHELKTPLTVVRLQVEKALAAEELPPENRVALEEALGEVGRLEKVIQQLLLLAQTEAESLQLNRRSVSGAEYLEQFAEDADALASDAGRSFCLERNEDARVSLDPSWIRQALFNLLSNAIKFSPPGGAIRMRGVIRDGFWTVEMEDEGPGAPEDQLERMFQRFARIGVAVGQPPGAGLGLAVCKGIMELHGGSIRAFAKTADRGFRVEWSLPLEAGEEP